MLCLICEVPNFNRRLTPTNMLDNETYLLHAHYLSIRRNALANILEGLDQEALDWLSKCIAQSSSGEHGHQQYSEDESAINDDDDEEDTLTWNDVVELAPVKTWRESCAIKLISSPFGSGQLQQPPLVAIRRNALHDLLETLTPAEVAKLKQLYQLQDSMVGIADSEVDHSALLIPKHHPIPHFGKFVTHI